MPGINPSHLEGYKAQVIFCHRVPSRVRSPLHATCFHGSNTVTDRGLSQLYPVISVWSVQQRSYIKLCSSRQPLVNSLLPLQPGLIVLVSYHAAFSQYEFMPSNSLKSGQCTESAQHRLNKHPSSYEGEAGPLQL